MSATQRVTLLGAVLLALAALCCASAVVDLTPDNFDELVAPGSSWLVEFYAPWCGHCKRLAPVYELVAEELAGSVRVGKVDADAHRDLGKRFGVRGFPTIKFIANGQVYDYNGNRGQDDLIQFALGDYAKSASSDLPQQTTGDVVELDTASFDVNVQKPGTRWLVEFYAPWCGHCKRFAPVYEELASQLKGTGVSVAKVDSSGEASPSTARRFGVKGFPTVILVVDGERYYTYNGERTGEALGAWAQGPHSPEEGTPYPAPRGIVDEVWDAYAELFNMVGNVMRKYIWLTVGGSFLLGGIISWLIFGRDSRSEDAFAESDMPAPSRPQPKPLAAAAATAASSSAPSPSSSAAAGAKPKTD